MLFNEPVAIFPNQDANKALYNIIYGFLRVSPADSMRARKLRQREAIALVENNNTLVPESKVWFLEQLHDDTLFMNIDPAATLVDKLLATGQSFDYLLDEALELSRAPSDF